MACFRRRSTVNEDEDDDIREREEERERDPERNREKNCCTARRVGITLQALIYTANAALWVISVLSFTCGFVIGFSNSTIKIGLLFGDLQVMTPATIFIYYGLALVLVATFGCFSSISATVILTVIYILLIFGYIIFDAVFGYNFLFYSDGFERYYDDLNSSMDGYSEENATKIGIYPLTPTDVWEHLQRRGKCCGFELYEDWRRTNFSKKEFNIPDSCCVEDYEYRYCGHQVFRHPDIPDHHLGHLVHPAGCVSIFPDSVTLPINPKIPALCIFLCCLLLFCLILSLVLLCMIATKKFTREQGLDNPDYIETRKPSLVTLAAGRNQDFDGSGEHGPTKEGDGTESSRNWKFKTPKVHPENDKRKLSNDSNKRVLFRESGPQFIHDDHLWNSDHDNPTRGNTPHNNRNPKSQDTDKDHRDSFTRELETFQTGVRRLSRSNDTGVKKTNELRSSGNNDPQTRERRLSLDDPYSSAPQTRERRLSGNNDPQTRDRRSSLDDPYNSAPPTRDRRLSGNKDPQTRDKRSSLDDPYSSAPPTRDRRLSGNKDPQTRDKRLSDDPYNSAPQTRERRLSGNKDPQTRDRRSSLDDPYNSAPPTRERRFSGNKDPQTRDRRLSDDPYNSAPPPRERRLSGNNDPQTRDRRLPLDDPYNSVPPARERRLSGNNDPQTRDRRLPLDDPYNSVPPARERRLSGNNDPQTRDRRLPLDDPYNSVPPARERRLSGNNDPQTRDRHKSLDWIGFDSYGLDHMDSVPPTREHRLSGLTGNNPADAALVREREERRLSGNSNPNYTPGYTRERRFSGNSDEI